MSANSDSQCYFVQLQIDSFLDGELNEAQQETFMSHVHQCQDCASEFRYAQTVQDNILDLPLLDCDEQVLEPVMRLGTTADTRRSAAGASVWTQFVDWFSAGPQFIRYGVPAMAVVALAITVNLTFLSPATDMPVPVNQVALEPSAQIGSPALVDQYSPEEIFQAVNDLNLAMDYLNDLTQRTEVLISDRFLVTPLQESVNASFDRANSREDDPLNNGPI